MNNSFSKLGLGTSAIASFGRSLSYIRAKKLFDTAFTIVVLSLRLSKFLKKIYKKK